MRIKGTRGDDRLTGTFGDDLFILGDGNDFADGGSGRDMFRGGAGNESIYGGDGADTLLGGEGSDLLIDDVNYTTFDWSFDQLRGGNGDDYLRGGLGGDLLVGGNGNDVLDLISGIAYGDEQGGERHFAGRDLLTTNMLLNYGVSRAMVGGHGADLFSCNVGPEGIPTQLDVLDFDFSEGDRLLLSLPGPGPDTSYSGPSAWALIDTNGDLLINGQDAPGSLGHAEVVDGNLAITLGDDRIVLHGIESVIANSDWLLG